MRGLTHALVHIPSQNRENRGPRSGLYRQQVATTRRVGRCHTYGILVRATYKHQANDTASYCGVVRKHDLGFDPPPMALLGICLLFRDNCVFTLIDGNYGGGNINIYHGTHLKFHGVPTHSGQEDSQPCLCVLAVSRGIATRGVKSEEVQASQPDGPQIVPF